MKLVQLCALACLFAINATSLEAMNGEAVNSQTDDAICKICHTACDVSNQGIWKPQALPCGDVFHAICVGRRISAASRAKCPDCSIAIRDLALLRALTQAVEKERQLEAKPVFQGAAPVPSMPVAWVCTDMAEKLGWNAADWDAAHWL